MYTYEVFYRNRDGVMVNMKRNGIDGREAIRKVARQRQYRCMIRDVEGATYADGYMWRDGERVFVAACLKSKLVPRIA